MKLKRLAIFLAENLNGRDHMEDISIHGK